MMRVWAIVGLFVAGCLVFARGAFAQVTLLEGAAGYAAFVDDAPIDHAAVTGAVRWPLTPRLTIGPEISYMRGPGRDRDLLITGNVVWDVVGGRPRHGLVVPYLVGGAGLFRHSDRFGVRTFASTDPAFTAGGGMRAWLSPRIYVGAEARVAWELHTRIAGLIGVRLGD